MANSAPTLTGLDSSTTFSENTVNATPQLIDSDVTLSDQDGNLAGGTLTVTGLLPEDVVSIRNEGTGAGQVGFFAGAVTYQGMLIGQAVGGGGGTFAVTLNVNASVAAVEALIENLTYANSSDVPTASRALAVNVTDGAGASAIAPIAFAERTGAANPLNGFDPGQYSKPSFADLDGDGDLDAVVGEGEGDLHYFQNVGTPTAPAFAAAVLNPFGLARMGTSSAPSFADLDGDNDLDALVGDDNGSFNYFENTGTETAPAFAAAVVNPFGLASVGLHSVPSLADLDGDGDLDTMVGAADLNLYYFQNIGTASAPTFAAAVINPFGLTGLDGDDRPSFADLNDDGDLDLVVGEGDGDLRYFESIGTASTPAFAASMINPFGLTGVGRTTTPSFADLDGDGDPDLVVGETGGTLHYFENTTPHPSFEIAVTVTPENDAPAFTSATALTTAENQTAVATVTASDVEGDAISFVLAGGGDAAFFAIDPNTGALSFIAAPDFETPEDADGDNAYDLTVSATDSAGAVSTQTISVAVTNVDEPGRTFNGGLGCDALNGTPGNDTMRGYLGDDTLDGGDGNDHLEGGLGNDTLRGERGDDTLEGGLLGDDTLAGGKGNDVLTGGLLGSDTFVFEGEFGTDIVTDFGNGDHIEFDDDVFADFAAVLAASQQVDANTVITLDAENAVTLQNVSAASLQASNFLFV